MRLVPAYICVMIVLVIALTIIPLVGGMMPEYSIGSRTGQIVKLSNKGIVFKSEEGKMILGGLKKSGEHLAANTWNFSVRDQKLVEQIRKLIDQQDSVTVTLDYKQYLIKPVSIDSDYVITAIRENK